MRPSVCLRFCRCSSRSRLLADNTLYESTRNSAVKKTFVTVIVPKRPALKWMNVGSSERHIFRSYWRLYISLYSFFCFPFFSFTLKGMGEPFHPDSDRLKYAFRKEMITISQRSRPQCSATHWGNIITCRKVVNTGWEGHAAKKDMRVQFSHRGTFCESFCDPWSCKLSVSFLKGRGGLSIRAKKKPPDV